MVELNETNCKEYSTDDFESKMIELASAKLKKELKAIDKEVSVAGWKSEEGKALSVKSSELRREFMSEYGSDALVKVLTGKQSSSGIFKNTKKDGAYGAQSCAVLDPHFTRNLTTLKTNPIDEETRKIVEMFGFAEPGSYDMFDGHLRGI